MKFLMLSLTVLSIGAIASAQVPRPRTHIMHDGDTRYVLDMESNQYMNLLCQSSAPMPTPPPTPPPRPIPVPRPIKVCELRFNPTGDSCSKYRVYIDGSQGSECMSTLQQATLNRLHSISYDCHE